MDVNCICIYIVIVFEPCVHIFKGLAEEYGIKFPHLYSHTILSFLDSEILWSPYKCKIEVSLYSILLYADILLYATFC